MSNLVRFLFSLAAAFLLAASLRRRAPPSHRPAQLSPAPWRAATGVFFAVAARPRRLRPGQRAHPHLLLRPGVPPHQVGVPLRPQLPRILQPGRCDAVMIRHPRASHERWFSAR